MNRKQEYLELKQELEGLSAPGGSVLRAAARQRKSRRNKFFLRPLAGMAAAIVVFVLLVNVSPSVALACEGIPILGDLAEAVRFSRSLSDAVENEHYQKINQQQTIDGVTVSVDYLIADKKGATILYHLVEPEHSDRLALVPNIVLGEEAGQYHSVWRRSNDGQNQHDDLCTVYYDSVPESIYLELELYRTATEALEEGEEGKEEEHLCTFEFQLEPDPQLTVQEEHYDMNQVLELDGQRIVVKGIDIYPTFTCISVEGAPENTALLTGLDFYLMADDGTRFQSGNLGFVATENAETGEWTVLYTESVYFQKPNRLTLCITGAKWRQKDAETVVDLAKGTVTGMPRGAELYRIEQSENGWKLYVNDPDGYQTFEYTCCDPTGKVHDAGMELDWNPTITNPNAQDWIYSLTDYPWTEVKLIPCYSQISEYDTPVTVELEMKS